MTISLMNESHVPQIAALERLCFNDPWSENSIASELDNKLSLWLVALEEDTVIGYVGSQTVLGWTDMMKVAVHPDYRRRGVGKAIIEELIRLLKEQGSECLTLEVRASNESAKALYFGLDFVEVGRRKNYYHNPKEDALILRKEWTL